MRLVTVLVLAILIIASIDAIFVPIGLDRKRDIHELEISGSDQVDQNGGFASSSDLNENSLAPQESPAENETKKRDLAFKSAALN